MREQHLVYTADATRARQGQPIASSLRPPLIFVPNEGQTAPQVRFLAQNGGARLLFTATEVVFPALLCAGRQQQMPGLPGPPCRAHGGALRLRLVGANPGASIGGLDRLAGTANYLLAGTRRFWRTNLPTYARLRYHAVYPHIDLIFSAQHGQLEADWVLAPGALPQAIRFRADGAVGLRLDRAGALVMQTGGVTLRQAPPVVYQDVGGRRHRIAGRYVLLGQRQVGLVVRGYDIHQPLTVDPVLSYSTYLGGGSYDASTGIAVDAQGNSYVVGVTSSVDFPITRGAAQSTYGRPVYEAFVTKLSPQGKLIYSTYLGGSDVNWARGVAVDRSGAAYVTGYTTSRDFPLVHALQYAHPGSLTTAYVAKLNPRGTALLYSTILGWDDVGNGVAVDSAGNAYITGRTTASTFPTTAHAVQTHYGGRGDAFVTKVNSAGTAIVYSTYLGGKAPDEGAAIAVDGVGDTYITGATGSSDFPTLQPLQAKLHSTGDGGCQGDAFVTKLNPSGSALLYATYLGGSDNDCGAGIAVDTGGSAYVIGTTSSADFPLSHALQRRLSGDSNVFVTKLDPSGDRLSYSTYLGGTGDTSGSGIAVGRGGNAYITGQTDSPNFPVRHALQGTYGRYPSDAFVAELTPDGQGIVYSTYLGGNNIDRSAGIGVDGAGNAYVAGHTESTNFPTIHAWQGIIGDLRRPCAAQQCLIHGDAFVVRIGRPLPHTPSPTDTVFTTSCHVAHDCRFFLQTRHNLSGAFLAFWQHYGGVDTLGYPRSEPFTETRHLIQYTDRFALQIVGGTVAAASLGRLLTAGRTFPRVAPFSATATRRYFSSTGHSLAGRFLAYWRSHHGDVLLGAPIAEVTHETNGDGSGRIYAVQWFANGRLEYHPEHKGTRYEVQIGLAGKEALQRLGWLP